VPCLLQRILASQDFQRARRLRDLLKYVVDRKLAGAPQDLTEVRIGASVFGRPEYLYILAKTASFRTEARPFATAFGHVISPMRAAKKLFFWKSPKERTSRFFAGGK